MMKRTVALLVAIIMTLGLTSCGANTAGSQPSTPTSGSAQSSVASSGSSEPITLKMLNIWCGADSKTAEWTKMVESFNTQYAGKYQIVLEDQSNYDAYAQKLGTMISSGNAPDLFTFKGDANLDLYSTSNHLMDITDILKDEKVAGRFQKGAIDGVTYDGKIYAMPYETAVVPIFYNNDILKKSGVSALPATTDDMLAMCKSLKGNVTYPIVQGTGNLAWFGMLWYSYCLASVGGADVYDTPFSEEWEQAAKLYLELIEYSEDDAVGATTSTVNGHFFNERGALYSNGTWILGRIASEGVAGLPERLLVSGSVSYNGQNGGGYVSQVQAYIAAAKTDDPARKEAIAAFYEWITDLDRVLALTNSSGSVFNFNIDASQVTDPMLSTIIDQSTKAPFLVGHVQGSVSAEVNAVFQSALEALILKDVTPKEFVQLLADANS